MRDRKLPYPVFDADNHMYENRDALTKFLPARVRGDHQVRRHQGPDKAGHQGQITTTSRTRPSPRWPCPAGTVMDVSKGGRRTGGDFRHEAQRVRAMPGLDAFFDPEPRLELMRDMGIDRTLLWPTLASAVEERLADDPDAGCVVIHALNEWMHEHWTYDYEDAIFATPIISLAKLDWAWRSSSSSPSGAPGSSSSGWRRCRRGRVGKSFALPEFDPFWARVQELGLVVGMHSGDPGYTRTSTNGKACDREATPGASATPAFLALIVGEGRPRSTPWHRSSATGWPPDSPT